MCAKRSGSALTKYELLSDEELTQRSESSEVKKKDSLKSVEGKGGDSNSMVNIFFSDSGSLRRKNALVISGLF